MDDEETQQLITELRRMLVEKGFHWAAEEAESDLWPNTALKTRALALIDAAEGVTAHLAQIELNALDTLEVEEIHFERDEQGFSESDEPTSGRVESTDFRHVESLGGRRRIEKLKTLAETRTTFELLKRRLDGDE